MPENEYAVHAIDTPYDTWKRLIPKAEPFVERDEVPPQNFYELAKTAPDPHGTTWNYEGKPTVDRDTGAMKGRKDIELFTAPPLGLAEYGKVCSYGSNGKYAQNNWRLGFQWSLSANAMLRHYLAWVGGEDLDSESGLHHLAHAAWHCLVLVQYSQDHPEKDDRFGMPADPATHPPIHRHKEID